MLKLKSFLSLVLLLVIISTHSCEGQENNVKNSNQTKNILDFSEQISQYVCGVLEDSKGNMWIGTLSRGVAKYDGHRLKYFTIEDGLIGNGVVDIVEDKNGNIWLGTQDGLSKYDGSSFTNFTEADGLINSTISNLFIDSQENFWIGTWGGVSLFDGKNFTDFKLPKSKAVLQNYQATADWITEIYEDKEGNIWFARDGKGVDKYDGQNWTSFTKKDGLFSSNVTDIQQDKELNIWFSSRFSERDHPDPEKRVGESGLNFYNGKNFTNFPDIESFNNDTYAIFEDSKSNIWIGTRGNGVYKYDGKSFHNYPLESTFYISDSEPYVLSIFPTFEDSKGRIWFSSTGGLYRLEGETIINITAKGPW